METKSKEKRGLAAIYSLCPVRHWVLLLSLIVIALHLLTRHDHALMVMLSESIIRPIHRFMSRLCAHVPFSVAELLIVTAIVVGLVYIIYEAVCLIRKPQRLSRAYTVVITLLMAAAFIYAGYSALWGVYFYGDDFESKSGLSSEKVSVEQLETVTARFAQMANDYSSLVSRNEQGVYNANRGELLAKSPEVYLNVEKLFPCLEGPDIAAKGLVFSRGLSYLDYTGFFFPFTAEANLNTDFPPSLLASTIAHELAHQRGVAKEQEANFVAVLACLEYGDADYCYSAALLAYTYLGNALHDVAYDSWESIYLSLNDAVRTDFAYNRAYWQQFETPVQEASNVFYDNFLQSYDQKLGLKSYGACVDMLVNYYY